jgi:hypothetical protein
VGEFGGEGWDEDKREEGEIEEKMAESIRRARRERWMGTEREKQKNFRRMKTKR